MPFDPSERSSSREPLFQRNNQRKKEEPQGQVEIVVDTENLINYTIETTLKTVSTVLITQYILGKNK